MVGYIKIFRSMLEWEWYNDYPTFKLFMHLLLTVSYKDYKKQGVEIKAGSIDKTIDQLVQETGLSKMQVRRALDNLESTGEITRTVTHDLHRKFSVISIVKWDQFQDEQHRNNIETTSKQHRNNTLYKNIRIKEDKNIYRAATKFSNFDQRDLDLDALERKINEI